VEHMRRDIMMRGWAEDRWNYYLVRDMTAVFCLHFTFFDVFHLCFNGAPPQRRLLTKCPTTYRIFVFKKNLIFYNTLRAQWW
jgi:fumarate reductase subunit C